MKKKSYIHIYLFLICSFCAPIILAQETVKKEQVINSEDNSVKGAAIAITGKDVTVNSNKKGSQKNIKQNTAAISTIYSDDITKSTVFNPENALYGQLSGLTVLQNGGTPWDRNPDMFIRGISSLGSSLVLIDGIERPISGIIVDDIESVSVLKDAAALSIYGQRGANGAIVITTKKGEYNSFSVQASYHSGITMPKRLPNMLNAYNYAQAVNEASALDGNPFVYTPYDLADYNNNTQPYYRPNVDWFAESFNDAALATNFNAQFKGGGDKIRYFSSLNYQSEEGHFKQTDLDSRYDSQLKYSRFNVRGKIDADVTSTTLLAVNLNVSMSDRTYPSAGINNIISAIYNTPSAAYPVRTENGNWGGTETYSNNPVAMISSTGIAENFQRELLGDVTLKQDLDIITEGLSAEVTLAFDNSSIFWEGKSKPYEYENVNIIRDLETGAITDTISTIYGRESDLTGYDGGLSQWRRATLRGKVNYKKEWNNNNILASVIYSQDKYVGDGQYTTVLRQNIASNVHYGYNNKYLLDFTLSYSGSSNLQENKRFGFFPAISAGWVLSEEAFLSSSSVDFLKIRASFGLTGSDAISANLYDQQFTSGGSYFFGDNYTTNLGTQPGRLATSGLTFESSLKYNVGVDMQFFSKLNVTLDAFYEQRSDILINSNDVVSDVIGVATSLQNDGQIDNKGIELDLLWQDKIGDFSYYLGGNFSYMKSKIVNINESYLPYDYLKSTGKSYGQQFGLEAVGFFENQEDIANSPTQIFSEVRPGDVKYKDQNNDNIIDNYDHIAIGYSSVLPEIYYGIKVGFEIKGLGVDAVFQGIANQTIYLNTSSVFFPLVGNTSISEYSANRWVPQNTANAALPRLSMNSNSNNYRRSTLTLVDGDYLKLRSLNMYYKFPKNLMKKFKLANAKVFVRGMNLFSIDNVQIMDPEAIGITYPTLASYHIGVTLGL